MATEDLSTFTIADDPNNRLSLTSAACTATGMLAEDASYCFKDYLAGHFGNFTHLFDFVVTTKSANVVVIWSICDIPGSWSGMSNYTARVRMANTFTDFYFETDVDAGYLGLNPSAGTTYYFKVVRNGTTVTLTAYSDAARTNQLATISKSCGTDQRRYLELIGSRGSSTSAACALAVSNVDIGEGAPPAGASIQVLLSSQRRFRL